MLRLRVWKQTAQFSVEEDWIFASPLKLGRLPYSYTGFWRELEPAAKPQRHQNDDEHLRRRGDRRDGAGTLQSCWLLR